MSKYFKFLLTYIKYVIFFIYTKKDFKYDFPFPPKPLYRLLLPSYYLRFFALYYRRKKDTIKFKNDRDKLWEEKSWDQGDYLRWIKKVVQESLPAIQDEVVLDEILNSEPKNILEIGSGSGHTAAAFLIHFLNYVNFKSNNKNYKITYEGIDLSFERTQAAINFTNIFFAQRENIDLKFSKKNLLDIETNIKYDYIFLFSVFEAINDNDVETFIEKICKIASKGVYITDLFDRYPGGYPRSHKVLESYFRKYNFTLSKHEYKSITTKGFKNYGKINYFLKPSKENLI